MMLSTTVMTLCSSMHIGFVPSSACGSITLCNFTKILQCGYLFSSQLDCKCLSSTLSWYYFFFTLKLQLGESCLMGLVGAMLRICLSWLQTVYTTLSKVCSMVYWWVDLRGENEATKICHIVCSITPRVGEPWKLNINTWSFYKHFEKQQH